MSRGPPLNPAEPGTIVALLGPTNTGKTYVTIQRMLGHRSGMMGLPLRLLAREVYDKVVRATSPDQVALVTGEEKRVPPGARYWICTVESMPVDRPVSFLAIDEVQLAGDPWRGHVFTDRILHARGVVETWFLGSDTIAPLLQQLVPTVQIRSQPRLSKLSWAGSRKLTALPPRSAVVAFSVRRVYELADRLRARHGGAAVVLGALSPRARNAQVEMYTNGDVSHMVATDAIGMGLNLDVHHVALAGTAKFDGRQYRPLRDDELAQIAGRAGRFRRDGTFGVTAGCDPLEPDTVEALESHGFPPLARLYWRNSRLRLDSIDTLLEDLSAPSPRRFLKGTYDATDARALAKLATMDEVRQRARGRDAVRLLWAVSRVPDFGNTLADHHAELLARLYVQLVDHDGELPEAFLAKQVHRIDRTEGDIATLTARIAAIRIWTYVVNQRGWVADERGWQERMRATEDRLSDALHSRLTARFVDQRATALVRWFAEGLQATPEVRLGGTVEVMGQVVGSLRGLRFEPAPSARPSPALDRAVRRAITPLLEARVEALETSPPGAFAVDPTGQVRWDGAPIARLLRGTDWRKPTLKMLRTDLLTSPQRVRTRTVLDRWHSAWLKSLTSPLDALETSTHGLRAIEHGLRRGLGMVHRDDVREALLGLDEDERSALRRGSVRTGRFWLYHRELVRRAPQRAVLARVWTGDEIPLPEDDGDTPHDGSFDGDAAEPLGFVRVGTWWVRVDVFERILSGATVGDREVSEAIRAIVRPPKPKKRSRRRRPRR
jgi:ATP-dependent RNA helicase SUPV3L1/SUV3